METNATCFASAGTCVVSEPVYFAFECQLAAFGGYLPHSSAADAPVAVTFAQDADMLACSSPQSSNPESKIASAYHDAIVIVRRGQCAFQDKLAQLMASSGDIGKPHAMVLINSEDKLLQLGGLTYDGALSSAFAVSVKKSDGEKLLQLVQQQHDHGSVVKLSITSSLPLMLQALQRIQHLLFTNFPLIAYETYMNEISPTTRNFDALLRNLNAKPSMAAASLPLRHEWIEFFHQCALAFPSQWEFTSSVSLHAAVSAASLLDSYQPSELDNSAHIAEIWQLAAHKLAEAGYYSQAQFCLQQIQKKSPALDQAAQCQLAFVNFLQGDIVNSVPTAKHCLESLNVGVNISARSLNVAHELLVRLAGLDMSSDDLQCLRQATCHPKPTEQQQQPMVKCCQHHTLPSRDEVSKQSRKRRKQFFFHSAFVEELFHSLTIMGVFLDELGAFNESLTFFQHASQLCPDDVSLQLRQVLAVPIVFGSSEEITEFYTTLETKVSALTMAANKKNPRVKELILSSITGSAYTEERSHMRPEEATYLQYTITPPTMFVGYQGIDVLPVQRAINELRKVVYPSLQSIEPPKPFPITESAGGNSLPSLEPTRKRRVAFISTWFRNHSVGKLLLGVVQRLDRAKFHVLIYRCVHFLRDSDELTNQFRSVADTFVDLPVNHEDALALLSHDAIDVAVYPELGMDEWLVLLSHHRIAPVQCVFWGHPITTGNPAIDFFISSEYFVSNFFEHDAESTMTMANDAEPFRYHGSGFSEQIVLFRGLGTFFTRVRSFCSCYLLVFLTQYICKPYLTLGCALLYAAAAGEDEYATHAQHATSTREPPVVRLSPGSCSPSPWLIFPPSHQIP